MLIVYYPANRKIQNFDFLKKFVTKYDIIIIFCDDGLRRQLYNKLDKLILEVEGVKRRIDLISHDTILINLYRNAHSSLLLEAKQYEIDFLEKKIRIDMNWIEKIGINDPLVMYYGFDAG